jgi:hypothetical protein
MVRRKVLKTQLQQFAPSALGQLVCAVRRVLEIQAISRVMGIAALTVSLRAAVRIYPRQGHFVLLVLAPSLEL